MKGDAQSKAQTTKSRVIECFECVGRRRAEGGGARAPIIDISSGKRTAKSISSSSNGVSSMHPLLPFHFRLGVGPRAPAITALIQFQAAGDEATPHRLFRRCLYSHSNTSGLGPMRGVYNGMPLLCIFAAAAADDAPTLLDRLGSAWMLTGFWCLVRIRRRNLWKSGGRTRG
jgi:hypothetical protein